MKKCLEIRKFFFTYMIPEGFYFVLLQWSKNYRNKRMCDESESSFIIGTRSSDLALWQAYEVMRLLRGVRAGLSVSLESSLSSGDVTLSVPLSALAAASPGVFTKELEVALIARRVHVAVHSLKDVPTSLPPGLVLAGVPARADARDACVVAARHAAAGVRDLSGLPAGAVVGTSSLRREAFLKKAHPHLRAILVRGNLNTRFRKLDAATNENGEGGPPPYDALLLAHAGLLRLGPSWSQRAVPLSPRDCAYGVSQGALAIEANSDDARACALARAITHAPSAARVFAERAFLRAMQGGCQVPIGVESILEDAAEGGLADADIDEAAMASQSEDSTMNDFKSEAEIRYAGSKRMALTLSATVSSLDASAHVTCAVRAHVNIVCGAARRVVNICGLEASKSAATSVLAGDDDALGSPLPAGARWVWLGVTADEWAALQAEAEAVGVALAAKVTAAGGDAILKELRSGAPPRPTTYGAAEVPLDR
jgi:hydroxymethylbilane synthase